MKKVDKEFFISLINRVIQAYECGERTLPGDRCEFCPFGYGYLDDAGDHEFWWCNNDKIEEDAVNILRVLKEKI